MVHVWTRVSLALTVVLLIGCTSPEERPGTASSPGSSDQGDGTCQDLAAPHPFRVAWPNGSYEPGVYDVLVQRRLSVRDWEGFVVGTVETPVLVDSDPGAAYRPRRGDATAVIVLLRSLGNATLPPFNATAPDGTNLTAWHDPSGLWRRPMMPVPTGELAQAAYVFPHGRNERPVSLTLGEGGSRAEVPLAAPTSADPPVCRRASPAAVGLPGVHDGVVIRVDNFSWYAEEGSPNPQFANPDNLIAQFDLVVDSPTAGVRNATDIEVRFTNGRGWWDAYSDIRPPGSDPRLAPGEKFAEHRCVRVTKQFGPRMTMYIALGEGDAGLGFALPEPPSRPESGTCRTVVAPP